MSGKASNSIAAISLIVIGAILLLVFLIGALTLILSSLGLVLTGHMVATAFLPVHALAILAVIVIGIVGACAAWSGFAHFLSDEARDDHAQAFAKPKLGEEGRPMF